ncbi:ABC transporter ATP-binding protein [Pseudodesulfovibrio thermohalotolerans]|uniref:ABC transporter ATP-binding protein n=1 Tax=Pseudodesulfovibrio thermohalotolerans TaxID=2880651 RepID=UPI0024423048|nr:ABC transporter ATP-binding protein [Pseudodesulfovibrio thermohalotolerans]WFS60900.1 ABC transporter ATP-binding protein [Pseudodesulfovibrio thermohalotolerans]
MASITIDNIQKSYGATKVLKDISLDIKDGEFISLLGSSGCGKSTLLRIISGLEQQTDGTLLIGGKDVSAVTPKNRKVSMVFQSYALYPHLTVRQNMSMPLVMRGLSAFQRIPFAGRFIGNARSVHDSIRLKVEETANVLDIGNLLDRKPSQLSGGQRQRVALGRAMVRNPEVFLMDEPLSNLDTKMRAHMRTELAAIHRRLGTTFVYVTHDQEEAMTLSDRVALMMDGQLIQVDAPRNIYRNPKHRDVAEFIGSPKINIIPGRVVESGVLQIGEIKISAPSNLQGECSIGVRPSRLRVHTDMNETGLRAVVTNIEDLGSTFLIYCNVEELGINTISRRDTREAVPELGSSVRLNPSVESVRYFDADGWNCNYN